MSYKNIFHKVFPNALSLLVLGLTMESCVLENSFSSEEEWPGNSVYVSADIAQSVNTRTYIESGRVLEGNYQLTYPQSNNNEYVVGQVDFGATETPGLGLAYSTSGTELKWKDIGGSPVTFYLDNVSLSPDSVSVTLPTESNPYKAGPFDDKNGSNDLLWGSTQVSRDTRTVSFDLHHNMSRVNVQVKIIKLEGAFEEINLEGASVELTNIFSTPTIYNRLDGTLTYDEEITESVSIVGGEAGDWKGDPVVSDDGTETTYISSDIVLPPQALMEDNMRPKLVITLANGEVYSGILPHAMFITNPDRPDNDELSYPVNLAFLKEHILTIRTVITEEPPELAFMPVYVTDWVYKGTFDLEAHQAGIYLPDEFYSLINYYKANNEIQLVRYGYETTIDDTSEWVFDFFSNVTLDYNSIYNQMKPGVEVPDNGVRKNFTFDFHNYSVTVSYQNEKTEVNPMQLYLIVTGNLSWADLH